nr:hypothetical protein [uncultured Dysosmobacter sp.]
MQIGYFHLRQDKVFRRDYECAAWYKDILVKAGKYPAEAKPDPDNPNEMGRVFVHLPGVVQSDYFGALYCGMPISDYDSAKNAGTAADYLMDCYPYSVADSALNEPDTPWELLPEFEARTINGVYNGTPYTTHGIFRKGAPTHA